MSATVYFSPVITPEKVLDMFKLVDKTLPGNIAIKLHSGEKGNQNFLGPEFWKPVIDYVGGTVVECNTAYGGARNTTEKHRKLMDEHGWSRYFTVDLLDAEGPDMQLDIPNGKVIKKDFVGKDLKNYDSMLVLAHFKGHPMAGFGGALKNVSIGMASAAGKAWIHTAGKVHQAPITDWSDVCPQNDFLESMAEACESVFDRAGANILYISVANNLSIDCDCVDRPEKAKISDIGILASLDPVALDRACVDMIYNAPDPGKTDFIQRMEDRNATHLLDYAEQLGLGQQDYKIVQVEP